MEKEEKNIEKPKTKPEGKPGIWKDDDVLERYIKIWTDWSYFKLPIWEIQKRYDISKSTVSRAIKIINKYFIKIPNQQLLQGAVYAIETRIKNLTNQLDIEYKAEAPSVRNIKELNSEIRSDSIELLKLQNLLKERYEVSVEGGSIKEILKILSQQVQQDKK